MKLKAWRHPTELAYWRGWVEWQGARVKFLSLRSWSARRFVSVTDRVYPTAYGARMEARRMAHEHRKREQAS